ncbi:hypothetical protein ED21_26128 [Erythrobacter sp. SD-21]|nr:hypothetical protein ED21_26128 [Erythrobacter sp. SD-21]
MVINERRKMADEKLELFIKLIRWS